VRRGERRHDGADEMWVGLGEIADADDDFLLDYLAQEFRQIRDL
jgi:hypothetical protein